jgi:hypothetical protein
MKIYLAGPMRGIPKFNKPLFNYAEKLLTKQGYTVFNPARKGIEKRLGRSPGLQENITFRRKVFGLDCAWICKHADGVALLPGWRKSAGAKAERALAKAVGLEVFNVKFPDGLRKA